MRRLTGYQNHKCAPQEWRRTQDITGNHEFDKSIQKCSNKDMGRKLKDYVVGGDAQDTAYGPLTGYNGYHNYHGDS